jgi:hypothetical protein
VKTVDVHTRFIHVHSHVREVQRIPRSQTLPGTCLHEFMPEIMLKMARVFSVVLVRQSGCGAPDDHVVTGGISHNEVMLADEASYEFGWGRNKCT